jgi:hypothetical protein
MTRGGLCVKLKNFAEHHHNPDRLLHSMKGRLQHPCGNLQ